MYTYIYTYYAHTYATYLTDHTMYVCCIVSNAHDTKYNTYYAQYARSDFAMHALCLYAFSVYVHATPLQYNRI